MTKCVNIVILLCRVYHDDGYLLFVTVLLIFVAFDVRIVLSYSYSASFIESKEVARLHTKQAL